MFNHPFEAGRPTRHGHPPPPTPETSHLHPQFFKPWALRHKWVIWPLLYILLLCALIPFGLFALNQSYIVGHFGAQPEDISFASDLTNVGLVAILVVQFRFLQYFERRPYLLIVIILSMLVAFADYFVHDLYVFMLLRLVTGFLVACMFGPVLLLITSLVPPPITPVVTATVFYSVVLGHSTVIGIFFVWVAQHMDWQNIYRYLFLFQALAMLIALLLLNKRSGMRKYPLYQIDWFSFIICVVALVSLAYLSIYGSKYYWFDDPGIAFAGFTAAAGFVLLFYRQLHLKRPYWHYAVWKAKHFLLGVTLLFLNFSIKDSIFLQGAASGFLLAPSIIFAVHGLPSYTGFTGIAVAAFTRLAAALTGFAAFYNLQLYFNQLNRETFIRHLTRLDPAVVERADHYSEIFRSKGFTADQAAAIANGNISRALSVQGQLLTDMHVFKAMAIVLLAILAIIVLAPVLEKGFVLLKNTLGRSAPASAPGN